MARSPDKIYEELIVLFSQGGDEDAMIELVRLWNPMLLRYATRLLGHADAAADVMQDAWIGIVRGIQRVEDPALASAWAHKVVAHKAADWIRNRKRARSVEGHTMTVDPAAPEKGASTEADRVRQAVDALDDPHREVVLMHYGSDLGVAEIAAAMDLPVGTVKSRLFHARRRIQEMLERSES